MKFEDLEAWQEARAVVRQIYRLTRNDGLKRDYGLCNQIQRSAVSVMTNIAEGFERVGTPEKLNFHNIARASAGETRSLPSPQSGQRNNHGEYCQKRRFDPSGV